MTRRTAPEPPAVAPGFRSSLQGALLAWYDRQRRDLPWRRTRDPYAIWLSEVMLQQTQVATAEPYYLRFMARYPDIASLAGAPLQEVLKMWQGLGYYSRARHLHEAARIMRDAYAGRVPDHWDHLRALPGVGDYIAAAVASIAFGARHAVVDGNVKRVLARLFTIAEPIDTPSGHRCFQKTAALLLEQNRPGDHNQALMELGALICLPRGPWCAQCPLSGHCRAHAQGVPAQYPKRRPRAPVPTQRAATVLLGRDRRILVVQRPERGLLGGLWELPGAPLPAPSADLDTFESIRGHIRQRFGLHPMDIEPVGTVRHRYTHFKLELSVFRCLRFLGRLRRNGNADAQWVREDCLHQLPMHKAAIKALTLLGVECGSDFRP